MRKAASRREAGAYGAAQRQFTALLRETQSGTPERAAVHNQLGILGKATGSFAEARRHYLRALPIVRRFPRNPWVELADLYHNLGGLEHARGNHQKGEPLARRSVQLRARRHGANAIDTWLDRTAHAALLHGVGRFREAAQVYRRALPVFTRYFGAGHFEIAMTRNNLGCVLADLGREAEGRKQVAAALRLFTRLLGARHPTTLACRQTLSRL